MIYIKKKRSKIIIIKKSIMKIYKSKLDKKDTIITLSFKDLAK